MVWNSDFLKSGNLIIRKSYFKQIYATFKSFFAISTVAMASCP